MKNNTFKTTGRTASLLVLLLLIVVLALSRGAVQSKPQPQNTTGDPQVQKLNEMLQRTDLSAEVRQELEEKRVMAERMALESIDPDTRPVEQRGPKVPPALAEPLMIEPVQPLWEGIFEGSEGLVRPSAGNIVNGWQGSRSDADYQVFAGSTGVEPLQGLLIVVQIAEDQPTGQRVTYLAPDGVSSLTIIDVQETVLALETQTQSRLYFDLLTRQFQPAE